jgi:hypothetical protein
VDRVDASRLGVDVQEVPWKALVVRRWGLRGERRSVRWFSWASVLFFASRLVAACATNVDDGAGCPEVDGLFEPRYARVDGTCGDACPPNLVPDDEVCFEAVAVRLGLPETRDDFLDRIDTNTVQHGCRVEFLQTLSRERDRRVVMQGALELRSAEVLTGTVGREQSLLGVVSRATPCEGTYAAMLTRIPEGP